MDRGTLQEASDFQPHERSKSAREVAWPIVLGQGRFDQIHHRGQLSVYLRMVGKVPSIYGPSGDQPWL